MNKKDLTIMKILCIALAFSSAFAGYFCASISGDRIDWLMYDYSEDNPITLTDNESAMIGGVQYAYVEKPVTEYIYISKTVKVTEYVTVNNTVEIPGENITIIRPWQLGDDLDYIPIGEYPCRHNTLYAYYFLTAKGYEPVIYEDWAGSEYHLWVGAGDYIYSDGMCLPADYFGEGKHALDPAIAFKKLVDWVNGDS